MCFFTLRLHGIRMSFTIIRLGDLFNHAHFIIQSGQNYEISAYKP